MRIALFGDSITESLVPFTSRTMPGGLGDAVRGELARRGVASAGDGFIAAHPSVVEHHGPIARAGRWTYSGRWRFVGTFGPS